MDLFEGGNASMENIDIIAEFNAQNPKHESVGFIIKWNPRQEGRENWLASAAQQGYWSEPGAGKRGRCLLTRSSVNPATRID